MHRFTFHFQFFEQGWSETLFRAAPFGSSEGNLLENYIINRLQLLCTEARMVSIRASNVDSARDITIYPLPGSWELQPHWFINMFQSGKSEMNKIRNEKAAEAMNKARK